MQESKELGFFYYVQRKGKNYNYIMGREGNATSTGKNNGPLMVVTLINTKDR